METAAPERDETRTAGRDGAKQRPKPSNRNPSMSLSGRGANMRQRPGIPLNCPLPAGVPRRVQRKGQPWHQAPTSARLAIKKEKGWRLARVTREHWPCDRRRRRRRATRSRRALGKPPIASGCVLVEVLYPWRLGWAGGMRRAATVENGA